MKRNQGRGDWGEKGEGSSRNMKKGHMDKAKGGQDRGWEVGTAGVVGSDGEKMETTVLEEQLKKEKKRKEKRKEKKRKGMGVRDKQPMGSET